MAKPSKEILRNMITGGNLKTADDLHLYLRDMFKDVLQEILEAELGVELGYSKVNECKNRPLEPIYPSIFLDAIDKCLIVFLIF